MALSQSIRALLKTRNQNELEALVSGSKPQDVIDMLVACIHRPGEGTTMWNAILTGYATDQPVNEGGAPATTATLFRVVLATLAQLNQVEVPQKQCFDIVIRLFAELRRFDAFQLIELAEFCIDSLRLGDPKCLAWKDLLPELIKLLHQHDQLLVNGVPMSGAEYREQCVRLICTMRWPSTVLTPITMMFKEMPISRAEKMQVLHKICDNLDQLEPTELPPIAYQLFRLCNTAALVLIPVHGLGQYFQKHFYAHLFAEMDSDQSNADSIEQYSAREMQEAQETILYHLSKATEFRVDERDIVQFCRPMSATPRFMLSPFFLCAMLSVSATNRYPESTVLSTSLIMPFLRALIHNSASEARMCGRSAWARSTMMRPGTELSKILDVLVDQSKDGKEIVTPGIVWLAFALLKGGKAPELHALAIGFLEKFVKKRFIFGAGVVKNLVDFLLADLEAVQFSDCLTRLALTNTYTVSECLGSLQRVLDYLLLIPGSHAMRMMSFIIPLCKSSQRVRDMFIDMLRKAMYQRDSGTRQMGVYGFCLVLKHLRENNARRSATTATGHVLSTIGGASASAALQQQQQRLGYVFSQQSISGYSLMSQTLLDNDANPQRHFDMLALEIIGVLRKCFNQTYEVKAVLYEGLHRAIDFNPKLAPHIVQFLEWHFHKYFGVGDDTTSADVDASSTSIHNDDAAAVLEFRLDESLRVLDGTVSVWDHVGHLVQLMGHCAVVCRRRGLTQEVRSVSVRLEQLMRGIGGVNVERTVGLADSCGGVMDVKVMHLGGQFLNCLEALMGYALWSHPPELAAGLEVVLRLFKQHRSVLELLKASNVVKKTKRDKNSTASSQPAARRPMPFEPVNIWELATLERFLRVVFDDDVPFATATATAPLRNNQDFGRYVLRVALGHMQALRAVAEARHIKHSQSTFAQLGNITRVLWSQCVKRLAAMCSQYDVATAQLSCECFMQCLTVAGQLYAKKLAFFLQAITFEPTNTSLGRNCAIFLAELQTTMDKCLSGALHDGQIGDARIERTLLQCMDWLLDHLPADDPFAIESYNWLYSTCLEYNVDAHHIGGIHRTLFVQRMRTNTGNFFDSIARQCQQLLLGDEAATTAPDFTLKSIDAGTVDACVLQVCAALRQQIEDVEYFVTKARSLLAKLRIVGPKASESSIHDMRSTEQKISAQLILVAAAAIPLTTVGLPAGQCTDAVVRMLLDFYVCVANFTKHLLVRHASAPVVYAAIKFDRLMRTAGRPLAERVYDLIEHIENDVFADEQFSSNGATDRAKVLRATRMLPKLVLRIENVNKFVMALGKKTRVDLTAHLHIGTVRDFKIKKTALRKALDQSADAEAAQTDGNVTTNAPDEEEAQWRDSDEEVDDDDDDTLTEGLRPNDDDDCDGDDSAANSSTGTASTTTLTPPSIPSSSTTAAGILLEAANADLTRPEMALKNMAIMNARLKRRRTDENDGASVPTKSKPTAAKKKKPQRVPQVINIASASVASLARRSTRKNRSDSTTME